VIETTGERVHGRTLPALDGLRAVAAVLVVGFHVAEHTWPLRIGWAGVPIFFVLSGYLITRLSLADEEGPGFSFAGFWKRRVARIIPLYLLALSAYLVLPLVGSGGGGLGTVERTLPYYLTFNGEFAPHGPMTISWSLGIEEKFYLAWPVLAFGLLMGRSWRLPLTAVAAAVCLLVAPLAGVPNLPGYAALLVGAAVALLEQQRGWVRSGLRSPLTRPAGGWIGAAAIIGVLLAADLPEDGAWTYVVLAPVVGVFLLHLVHGRSAITHVLSTHPMRWLGKRSYGIYLIHPLALTVSVAAVPGSAPGRPGGVGLGCLVLTLVASDAAHRLVETPFIRWGRQWSAGRREPVDRARQITEPAI
jgi:peptidoglycan/LPS O-acetylase OafA/YrhL